MFVNDAVIAIKTNNLENKRFGHLIYPLSLASRTV